MPNKSTPKATLGYLFGVALLSPVEGVIATILGWSIVYGFPESLRLIQSDMDWSPRLWGGLLILSATSGWFVAIGCLNCTARWATAIVLLSGLHLMVFAFHLLISLVSKFA